VIITALTNQPIKVSDCDSDLADFVWFVNSKGYAVMSGDNEPRLQRMHRLVLARMLGRPLARHEFPDHINGDKLDNRRSNLRLATNAENAFNRGRNINNSTGYKGVYHNPGSAVRPFIARIMVNRQSQYLGSFPTAQEAALAYDAAAVRIAGQFAQVNGVQP
jgi:hypothetical protein